MGRTVALTKRYSITLAGLNAWTLIGGGLLITLGGSPFLGPLLIVAGVVFFGLAVAGKLQRQKSMSLGQSLISLLGIPIMFFGLLLLGRGLIPAGFAGLWYGFLAVLVVLAIVALAELARSARSTEAN